MLVVDDLQWMDDASINLLFHLSRHISASPILLVGAYRGTDVALGAEAIEANHSQAHPLSQLLTELTLGVGTTKLDRGEVPLKENREFVDRLLDSEPNLLGEGFRAKLFNRTKGHPLFTIELLRSMQTRRDLQRDEQQRWERSDCRRTDLDISCSSITSTIISARVSEDGSMARSHKRWKHYGNRTWTRWPLYSRVTMQRRATLRQLSSTPVVRPAAPL